MSRVPNAVMATVADEYCYVLSECVAQFMDLASTKYGLQDVPGKNTTENKRTPRRANAEKERALDERTPIHRCMLLRPGATKKLFN